MAAPRSSVPTVRAAGRSSRLGGAVRALWSMFDRTEKSLGPGRMDSIGFGGRWNGINIPLGGYRSASGQVVSQATAMRVSTVYACVAIRSEDLARCRPDLWRPNEDGTRTLVTDHPVAKLFRRPNRVQTWFEFAEQMEAALLLRSNAYAIILRDGRGQPRELIPVNPDLVQMLEAPGGQLFYNVSRVGQWLAAVLGRMPIAIPAEDVLHLRGLGFNTLLGAGRLALATDSVGLALTQEKLASKSAGNGSRLSGVLSTTEALDLTEEQAARIRADWQEINGGVENAGSIAILEHGLTFQAMSMTSVDAQFLESRQFQVEDICRFFRMPPHKVAALQRSTNNNIAAQDQDYVNNTVMPELERWEQKFALTFDLDLEGIEVDLDEEQLLRADIKTRYDAHRIGIMSGFLKVNEARRKEKLPPDPKGDKLWQPSNMAAAGSQSTGTAPDGAGRPADGELPG